MKEVELGRFAGPFNTIPFENYIQLPVGLIPKARNKTRLIFHLSFNFPDEEDRWSLNACTPKELCSVHYHDLDDAVSNILLIG